MVLSASYVLDYYFVTVTIMYYSNLQAKYMVTVLLENFMLFIFTFAFMF